MDRLINIVVHLLAFSVLAALTAMLVLDKIGFGGPMNFPATPWGF